MFQNCLVPEFSYTGWRQSYKNAARMEQGNHGWFSCYKNGREHSTRRHDHNNWAGNIKAESTPKRRQNQSEILYWLQRPRLNAKWYRHTISARTRGLKRFLSTKCQKWRRNDEQSVSACRWEDGNRTKFFRIDPPKSTWVDVDLPWGHPGG